MKLHALESSIVESGSFGSFILVDEPGIVFLEELNTLVALGILRVAEDPDMTRYIFDKDLVVEASDYQFHVLKEVLEIIK